MPILYQHTINNHTKLVLWQVVESMSFFQNLLPSFVHPPMSHPEKQLQFMAGRYLLETLSPSFPFHQIALSPAGKPFLPDSSLFFSISHSRQFVAAIISTIQPCGIDVEIISPKAIKILPKFLSDSELATRSNSVSPLSHDQTATLYWSIKESMYKWDGEGKIDFRKHLQILEAPISKEGVIRAKFHRETPMTLLMNYQVFDQCVLTWTCQ